MSRPAFGRASSRVRSCLVPRSLKSIGTETRKTLLLVDICGFEKIQMKGQRRNIAILFGQKRVEIFLDFEHRGERGRSRRMKEGKERGEKGRGQKSSWENRVGGNKIIAAWLRRCGIK